ncbi:hypothetical protein LTR91_020839 [Friedmanniomyces endolithicus]|uniref:Uncharacterized protein n=1 Tax=Friedmanniomyces endolithicus TaxID=329885 RepID=A0AAN6K4R5_9PEZI|nr:hypothetical protein LTR57_018910 [Friedmanniomyces endolithicus]KAK0926020.1 hypothetical protein LTR29_017966 [Friedmanniomyces endolithicus]KAK0959463.1 hypothetical protein LTR91_020839 [Friedmanniomyces endolithicus]KAK1022734.1 hypothetical protein LTS16_025478 [Friedmanniomyces endolithicus]
MQKSRTITIAVIEILNEVIPMGLVIHFVGNLQMSAQMRCYVMIGYISRFSNIALITILSWLSITLQEVARPSATVISLLVVQDLLVLFEFLCVVAIYLSRALNDFQTVRQAVMPPNANVHNTFRSLGNKESKRDLLGPGRSRGGTSGGSQPT